MKTLFFLLSSFLLFPSLASAHEVGTGGGFVSGLSHPVLGLDHLLAMISVGIISAQMGGRAIWTVPAVFVGVMIVGGVMGIAGIPFFSVELGIALSVLILGIVIAVDKKLPALAMMIAVGFFALFHGHAHGTEMPEIATPALYALGFTVGTATIHMMGVATGLLSRQISLGPQLLRYVGAAIAGIGLHILVI